MRWVCGSMMALAAATTLPTARAQTSASYRLQESVLNAGGHPAQGAVLSSPSFRVKLDALGDGVLGSALASPSFRMDGGFVGAYPPPGEVRGDRFASKTLLVWDPEKSVGTYDVYRGSLASLSVTFGICLQSGLTTSSFPDTATPDAGTGYFYLITARNRLGEEGTKGRQSNGAERPNAAPCP